MNFSKHIQIINIKELLLFYCLIHPTQNQFFSDPSFGPSPLHGAVGVVSRPCSRYCLSSPACFTSSLSNRSVAITITSSVLCSALWLKCSLGSSSSKGIWGDVRKEGRRKRFRVKHRFHILGNRFTKTWLKQNSELLPDQRWAWGK